VGALFSLVYTTESIWKYPLFISPERSILSFPASMGSVAMENSQNLSTALARNPLRMRLKEDF
jgi:hypothetical protein